MKNLLIILLLVIATTAAAMKPHCKIKIRDPDKYENVKALLIIQNTTATEAVAKVRFMRPYDSSFDIIHEEEPSVTYTYHAKSKFYDKKHDKTYIVTSICNIFLQRDAIDELVYFRHISKGSFESAYVKNPKTGHNEMTRNEHWKIVLNKENPKIGRNTEENIILKILIAKMEDCASRFLRKERFSYLLSHHNNQLNTQIIISGQSTQLRAACSLLMGQ